MKSTAPGFLAVPAGRASTAGGLPVAADPSAAGFRALALQVRAMGLLDRRPGMTQGTTRSSARAGAIACSASSWGTCSSG
jgi:hypothetical protein